MTQAWLRGAAVILVASAIFAQDANSARDRKLIAAAKAISASELDPKLPRETLEHFLELQAAKTCTPMKQQCFKLIWEVNDCGEQTGSPADRARDFPMCVQATAELTHKQPFVVSVVMGTFKRGIVGRPQTAWILVGDKALKTLSEIPSNVGQIRAPQQPVRDLPAGKPAAKP